MSCFFFLTSCEKSEFSNFSPKRESRRFRNGPTIELATGRLFLPIVHLEVLYTDGRCGSSENLVELSRQASKVFKVVESKVQLLSVLYRSSLHHEEEEARHRNSMLGYFIIDRYENFEAGRHGGKVGDTKNYTGQI